MTLLIHEVNKEEDLFLKDDNIPDPSSMENVEFKIFQTIIKRQLEGGDTDKWNKIVNTSVGIWVGSDWTWKAIKILSCAFDFVVHAR